MRLFFAITLPSHPAEAVIACAPALPGVRHVPAVQLHFTLRFLGEIADERVPEILAAAGRAVAGAKAFEIELGEVGSFANPRETVVWIGVEHGAEAMAALAVRINKALDEIGIPREPRRFMPHLTLARVKNRTVSHEVISHAKSCWSAQKGVDKYCIFVIDSFVMMRSELHSTGPIYTVMERFPLIVDSAAARPLTADSELI